MNNDQAEPIVRIEVDFVSVTTLSHATYKTHTFLRDENPALYRRARKAVEQKNYGELYTLSTSLLDNLAEIDKRFVVGAAGDITFDGVPVNNWVVDRVRSAITLNKDPSPWINFLRNIMANPHAITVDDIYRFMDNHEEAPITEDGAILAYKKVNEDYYSFFVGTDGKPVRWAPGDTVELPRDACDMDRNNTCSTGLHFCSRDYLPAFYGDRGRVVMVKIFPQDIVSIPLDYQHAKGRCCRAYVVREIEDLEKFAFKSLYSSSGDCVECDPHNEAYFDDLVTALELFVEDTLASIEVTLHELIELAHAAARMRGQAFVYDEEEVAYAITQGAVDGLKLLTTPYGLYVQIN